MEIYIINNKPTVEMSLDEYKDLMVTINKLGAENDELKERNDKLTDLYKQGESVIEFIYELTKLNLELKEENEKLRKDNRLLTIKLKNKEEMLEKSVALYNTETTRKEDEIKFLEEKINELKDDLEKALKERHMFKRIADAEQDNAIKAEEQTKALEAKLAAIEDIIKGES